VPPRVKHEHERDEDGDGITGLNYRRLEIAGTQPLQATLRTILTELIAEIAGGEYTLVEWRVWRVMEGVEDGGDSTTSRSV
jgi:hypothetical protein